MTPPSQSQNRSYLWLLGLTTACFILPIWLCRFLPFVDLPQHLNFVNILRHYGNPATGYQNLFEVQLYPAHNLLHLLFSYGASFLVGIEGANRLYLTVYVIMFIWSLVHLIDTMGGNRGVAFLGFLLVYNFVLFWGFVSAVMSIPLILLALSYEMRWLNVPSSSRAQEYRRLAGLGGLMIMIFLSHALMFLFALVCYLMVLFVLLSRRQAEQNRVLGLGILPLAPVVLFLVLPWQARVFSVGSGLTEVMLGGMSLREIVSRPVEFFTALGLASDDLSLLLYKLVFVAAMMGVIGHWRQARAGLLRVAVWLTLTAAIGYLFLPAGLGETMYLNARFAVFTMLFLIVAFSIAVSPVKFRPPVPQIALAVVLVVHLGNMLPRFIAFDRQAKPVVALLDRLPKNQRLLGMIYDADMNPDLLGYSAFLQFPCYYPVWKQGYAGFSLAAFSYFPIHYRADADSAAISGFLAPGEEWSPWLRVLPEGWQFYDYFLVRGRTRPQDQPQIDRWHLIGRAGDWRLYSRPDWAERHPYREQKE